MTLYQPALPVWPEVGDGVVDRFVERHLTKVLPIEARVDRRSETQLAGAHGMVSEKRLEQRGLSCPVRPYQPEHVAAMQRSRESGDERSLGAIGVRPQLLTRPETALIGRHFGSDPNLDVHCAHDDVAAPISRMEAERHRILVLDGWTEPGQPLEALATPLGLFCVLAGDV